MEQVQCAVIGAGVIGLAIARDLSLQGREVVILERVGAIGSETSARNSEVVHAGLYYPPGSLKARQCVEGRRLLYDFLASHGIAHRRCGKLIVAKDRRQEEDLRAIAARAQSCGVADLAWLAGAEARALEPALSCSAALISPSTGIVDVHTYMLALLGEAEARGAMLSLHTDVTGGRVTPGGLVLETRNRETGERFTLAAKQVVNAAGLWAGDVARRIEGLPPGAVPTVRFAKGNYFTTTARAPFSRLIYPVPVPGGLGIHLTLDLQGAARFGPDVEWCDAIDYAIDPSRGAAFTAAIREYWPELPDGSLQPAFCGIRPKLSGPGEPAADFRIDGPRDHGIPGLVNLFGIESPGLTASLAISRHVATLL